MIKQQPYVFVFHKVSETPPVSRMTEFFDRLNNGQKLTKEEQQLVFEGLYGMSGNHTPTYKLRGWAFPFRYFMKRFLVKKYGSWQEIFAFSKGNIRNNTFTRDNIDEIHEIPNK